MGASRADRSRGAGRDGVCRRSFFGEVQDRGEFIDMGTLLGRLLGPLCGRARLQHPLD